jgi:hypothetical protein
MAIRFLLDEQMRGVWWQAIQHHNAAGVDVLDVLCVGHPPAPPLGASDPDLLLWAEQTDRVFVSQDRKTIPGHFIAHLQAGHHSPGVVLLCGSCTVRQLIDHLVLYDQAADPQDLLDQIHYLP